MAGLSLAETFDDNAFAAPKAAVPPVLDAVAYQHLLERLVQEGQGYGKTEPVAAYPLSNLRLLTKRDNFVDDQQVRIDNLYVVMDLNYYPNSYGRALTMQAIVSSYAKRILGEADINAPDYEGPGVWTSKKSSFEFDYLKRQDEHADIYGRMEHIYDPNPEAYRICLTLDDHLTIPTSWGDPWEITPGGTLAIRERDVQELCDALKSIRDGLKTPEEALLKDHEAHARFDIYGMMPGFLKANYNPVSLKDITEKSRHEVPRYLPAVITQPAIVIPMKKA